MTATTPTARAASHADQAERALDRARNQCDPGTFIAVCADWAEAITHGLLAVAAAAEDSGSDTADAITDLGERLALVDGTIGTVADAVGEAAGPRRRRRMWRRHGMPCGAGKRKPDAGA